MFKVKTNYSTFKQFGFKGSLHNEPNSEWQFEENITLEDKKNGTIILDVLKGNKIGGVEFLKYLK